MSDDHGIAGEAHGLVYGARAATYGHPRFDFTSIAMVWTGLLQDLLKPGAQLDPYRISVLMTGLKLARLVKSPEHHDSRVDVIGYMLTMERLDEDEDEPEDEDEDEQEDKSFIQLNIWFEPGETKFVNGERVTNTESVGKVICMALSPGHRLVTIDKHPTPTPTPAAPYSDLWKKPC